MKTLVFGMILLSFSVPSFARCVVEIYNVNGEPTGYVYQETSCERAMVRCRAQLARLGSNAGTCEITLDIPGQTPSYFDEEY